jgi:hypothetical protein
MISVQLSPKFPLEILHLSSTFNSREKKLISDQNWEDNYLRLYIFVEN